MMKKINNVMDAIRLSSGRFFGLQTTDGRTFNAQLVRETPQGVRIYDRNRKSERVIARRKISSVRSQGVVYSV